MIYIFLISIITSFIPILEINKNKCINNSNISPVDINFPFKHLNFNLKYTFKPFKFAKLEKKDQIISFNADLGSIDYNNQKYQIKQLIFISPSEHLIGYNRFAVEMQIVCKTIDNQWLKLIIFFEETKLERNEFLDNLDFGTEKIKNYKNEKVYIFSKNINIADILTDSLGLFMYTGTETIGDVCNEEIVFISNKNSIIHTDQLKEFGIKKIRSQAKQRAPEIFLFTNRKKYVNFQTKEIVKFIKTPGSILYNEYLFNPTSNNQLGYIDNLYIPFWKIDILKLVNIIEIPHLPVINKKWRYEILFYKPIIDPLSPFFKKYKPIFVLTEKSINQFNSKTNPKVLNILLRSNVTNEIDVFPIEKVNLVINYTEPKDYLFKKETPLEKDLKQEKQIKKEIAKSKVILNKIEEIKKNEKKKPIDINHVSHVCIRHHLSIVLNKPKNKEDMKIIKNHKDLSKDNCKEWYSYISHTLTNHALNLIEAQNLNYKLDKGCIKLRTVVNNKGDQSKFIRDEITRVCPKMKIRHNNEKIILLLNSLNKKIKAVGGNIKNLNVVKLLKSSKINQVLKNATPI